MWPLTQSINALSTVPQLGYGRLAWLRTSGAKEVSLLKAWLHCGAAQGLGSFLYSELESAFW